METFRESDIWQDLESKIKALIKSSWYDKGDFGSDRLSLWLNNFKDEEKLPALFLLSKFMYFNNETTRELMHRLYEDLYKRPIVQKARKNRDNTKSTIILNKIFSEELKATRFLSIGNPSESSAHLLYYFRQENKLCRDLFVSPHQLITHKKNGDKYEASVNLTDIRRVVLIDDFCGSGTQAKTFYDEIVTLLKNQCPSVNFSYYCLYALEKGLNRVKKLGYDEVKSIFVLDESYMCFSNSSRYFKDEESELKERCLTMCRHYGKSINHGAPLGYKNCQLLIGFHHNTPNNTLPIFWSENSWNPFFKRYAKIYSKYEPD